MDYLKLLDFFGYFVGYLNYSDDYYLISYGNYYYFYFYLKKIKTDQGDPDCFF